MKNKVTTWILFGFGMGVLLLMVITALSISSFVRGGVGRLPLKENTYLTLPLSGPITEYDSSPDFQLLGGPRPVTLSDALRAIDRAAADSRIKGIVLRPYGTAGFADLRELRGALLAFKKSKKPVYAHLDVATDRDYYLASVADTVIMTPSHSGGLFMEGLGIASTYLAKTFEKVGIRFYVLHVGRYKGTYESLSRDRMSESLRESLQELLDDLFRVYTTETAAARPALPLDTLQHELMEGEHLLIAGAEAQAKGFVDLKGDWEDFRARLGDPKKLQFVTPSRYLRTHPESSQTGKEVALVFAEGDISYQKDDWAPFTSDGGVTSDEYVKLLRKLREDDNVAAVVVRVNSPGGSTLASELIYQEMMRLKAKKPVVVSMGRVAASGGYYVACGANRILAQPNTVTGSIGVVALFPSAQELYNKIGARVETVEKGKWAQYFRIDRDLSPEQEQVLLDLMKGIYDEFVDHVAQGRGMSVDSVETVASGRMWTGEQALERGLVDEIGGLDLAVERAKDLAKLKGPVSIRRYPRPKDLFQYMFEQFQSGSFGLRLRLLSPEEWQATLIQRYIQRYVRQRDFVQAVLPVDVP